MELFICVDTHAAEKTRLINSVNPKNIYTTYVHVLEFEIGANMRYLKGHFTLETIFSFFVQRLFLNHLKT